MFQQVNLDFLQNSFVTSTHSCLTSSFNFVVFSSSNLRQPFKPKPVTLTSQLLIRAHSINRVTRFKNGPFPVSFLYFRRFYAVVDSKQMIQIKTWQWLDSNLGPLVLEATLLQTANWPIPGLFFFIFVVSTMLWTVKQMLYIKTCRWMDSNRGPLELEATVLPTEPRPMPSSYFFWIVHCLLIVSLLMF